MKLEDHLFQSFFYPFVVAVALSAAVVILSSINFTNNYFDKGTAENVVKLEKNFAKVNLNSISVIINSNLLKVQAGLNEVIKAYKIFGKNIKEKPETIMNLNEINDLFFKSVVDTYHDYSIVTDNLNSLPMTALWLNDNTTNLSSIKEGTDLRKQLKIFSEILPGMFSTFSASNLTGSNFYFLIEYTDIIVLFPESYYHRINFINDSMEFAGGNPVWCTDSNGFVYDIYKFYCRPFYQNIQKSQTNIFDYNYDINNRKTLFITDFYFQAGEGGGKVFTMCILFEDPITDQDAYACADLSQNEMMDYFDKINNKLNGYFFITSVGFNHAFYFPEVIEKAETPCESIFRKDINFFLNEKTYFNNHIQKLMTSNYYEQLKEKNIFDEVYTNKINTEEQYFSINGENYNFSIYPVVFENLEGKKEHVFNIIYIYNNKLFYNRLNSDMNIGVQVILEAVIFVVFGFGLLYLMNLSLNILAKYIVIPIKNVNYMLKGINIGGDNRLEYLDFLKKKQDENIEMIERINMNEGNKKKENGAKGAEDNDNLNGGNNLIDDNKKEEKDEANLINKDDVEGEENNQNEMEDNNELIDSKIDYDKKFDEESEFIEKESNFYDFDEQLLQFRPLEIDRLVKALIDLKGALFLTSCDQPVEQIIDYSNSEDIFRNFKNKEGATICQSNIGNLESQLMKYDNAIYHLATSLQDNKLKRFLARALSDEYDESDTLLNKITISYSKNKIKEKMNVLIEKQLNNSKDNFSQKIIGILINTRYTRLIHVYFKFFSLIQKSNIEELSGQFMNTTFHNINYYHKILIQYIFLSFVKNDLIKIGESILDYIEFLLKFKFKTSSENKYLLNIHNRDRPELKRKQQYKRYIFDKIVNWLNLFDDYISHVRDNTSLGEDKSIIEDVSHNVNSSNSEFDSSSQSVFLFRVNLQRGEYLKGKFALRCKNINDALFYFIRSAKKESIVSDGLIKKKCLKRIGKILLKLFKKYDNYGIIRWQMREKFSELEKAKIRTINKKYSLIINPIGDEDNNRNRKYHSTFKQEMEKIKNNVINELNECNARQAKNIIIIIDFNKYNHNINNAINSTDKIDSFIDQTKTILDNYLSSADHLGVFIYTTQYQIICPLIGKNEIDINNFSKDLIYYKKSIFKEQEETEDDLNEEEINENDLQNEKIGLKENGGSNFSDSGSNESFKNKDGKQIKINDIVKGLIETINYSKNYLKMKEEVKNEKYIILFTDLFNNYKMSDDKVFNNFKKLDEEKNVIFLLVGKNKSKDLQKNKELIMDEDYEEQNMIKMVTDKFSDKSEIIDFENMKKIKNILSNNNVIKDDIIFPNEIYK